MRYSFFLSAALVCFSTCGDAVVAASDPEHSVLTGANSPVSADYNVVAADGNTKQERFLRHWEDAEPVSMYDPESSTSGDTAMVAPVRNGTLADRKKATAKVTEDIDDSSDSSDGSRAPTDIVGDSFFIQAIYHSQNVDKMYNQHMTRAQSSADLGLKPGHTILQPSKSLAQRSYEAFLDNECSLVKNKDEPACA